MKMLLIELSKLRIGQTIGMNLHNVVELLSRQGATVSEFAFLDRFPLLAQFGSIGEFKFYRVNAGLLVEKADNNIIFRLLERSSGQNADQTTIALSRFLGSQNRKSSIGFINGDSGTPLPTVLVILLHTPVKSYVVKWPQEKWACHSHDNATPLSFHLQVTQVFFQIS